MLLSGIIGSYKINAPAMLSASGGVTQAQWRRSSMTIISYKRKKISGVYSITNLVNGKFYIGSSVDIINRWSHHRVDLRNRLHHNEHLQRSWNKHGEPHFEFSIIEACDVVDILGREQFYIDTLRPEYNIAIIAGSCLGCVRNEETKRKISESNRGKTCSEETRRKLVASHIGNIIGEEQRRKMSEAIKGKYRGWSNKRISQYSRDNVLLNTFNSIMDAERATGIKNQTIVRCAKGKRPTAGNFIWKYTDSIIS